MRSLLIGIAVLIFGCSQDPFGPYKPKEPGFIGDWLSEIAWTDTTAAIGWQDGRPVKRWLPFIVRRTQIFRFYRTTYFSSYLAVQYEYPEDMGWTGTFKRPTDAYWIIFRGHWYNRGNLLRFVVESTERYGRWDFWPGSEYTVVWKRDGQNLILWWRDNTGF